MSLSETDRQRLDFTSTRIQFLSLCKCVFLWNGTKKSNHKRESRSLGRSGKQKWTQTSKIIPLLHFLFYLSSFFSSLSWKSLFYLFTARWRVRHSNLKIKRKKTRLFMNQQCVSMWVDKTASSCLVSFSLSYSVGQKVMPTGFRSHWKGPCSSPQRHCVWRAKSILSFKK